ncbi:MAG: HisA/HisF-related TIM barrel protein [Pikeienuella sp.]
MILYPTLQLLDGQCVTLPKGAIRDPEVWHGDPVARARSFVEAGAEWLHVTDLDAVRGTGDNADTVAAIIRQAGVPVQLAGGMTTDSQVTRWREAGAARIVFGSAAITALDWVKARAKELPDYYAVSIDISKGRVMRRGWEAPSLLAAADLVRALADTPLAAVIVTDIDHDIELAEASFALTTKMAEETRSPVISSGLVKTLDDLSTLAHVPNIAGALIGRPLFDKSIELSAAIEIARPSPEKTAEFL